jgi:transporter family-2 protein
VGNIFYIAAAIAIGACLSVQPPINSVMARTLGSPLLAASISIAISLILVVLVWLTWGKGVGDLAQIKTLPWWIVIGGLVGVIFVAGTVMLAPVLGVALLFACIISGQLLGSALADQLGAFGMPIKPINMMKLLGLCLVLAGALLVQKSNS